ncbi:MAG TPA: DUF6131 family protein [Solirubrobacteraceae bacterium]
MTEAEILAAPGRELRPDWVVPDGLGFYEGQESELITLGLILLIIGLIAKVAVLYSIGIILLVVGLILAVLGTMGRAIGGRRHYY